MKALSIFGLILAIISVFIPFFGLLLAMLCSLLALITFVKQPTISTTIFCINIISTAFFSPLLAAIASSTGFSSYQMFVFFHIILLFIAVILFLIFGKKNTAA